MDKLGQSIQYIKGVGPKRYTYLKKLGIEKVWDMFWYAPRHYFDRTCVQAIGGLSAGQEASLKGRIIKTNLERSGRGLAVFKAWLQDETGTAVAVWFNQAYLKQILKPGLTVFVTGKTRWAGSILEVRVNEFELLERTRFNPARIVPVYPATEGLSQKVLRAIAYQVLQEYADCYPEILPLEFRQRLGLAGIGFAWHQLHFPESFEHLRRARKRLVFEELFLWQWNVFKLREAKKANLAGGIAHGRGDDTVEIVSQGLPFQLTNGQQRVIREICADLASPQPMNRLLQGDVGSGKTVVAALAAAKVVGNGYQVALMAPTEILALQHYQSLRRIMEKIPVKVALLIGKMQAQAKKTVLEAVAGGEVDILVGTHAIIQEQVSFGRLGLVVIDEQQRFGVKQRARLVSKGEQTPDTLVMSATPIPRTLALALYGEVDISVIDELPPGRKEVKTFFIKPNIKARLYQFIRQEVAKGRQVYIICPLVEESEKQDLQAATVLQQTLADQVFPELQVGLLHGRMKREEKETITESFRRGETQILVTTTVIEVGIDVPNASVMVIEHAERFGLSQLHQLRGRVGRGQSQSYCILVGDPHTEQGWARLKLLERTNDGFEIAREDLRLRGPGDLWGVRQHGLPELKIADLIEDGYLLEIVQRELMNDGLINQSELMEVAKLYRALDSNQSH